jgi:Na+-transporting NADH:ubiquinone oxidoreductase subunit NqrD
LNLNLCCMWYRFCSKWNVRIIVSKCPFPLTYAYIFYTLILFKYFFSKNVSRWLFLMLICVELIIVHGRASKFVRDESTLIAWLDSFKSLYFISSNIVVFVGSTINEAIHWHINNIPLLLSYLILISGSPCNFDNIKTFLLII